MDEISVHVEDRENVRISVTKEEEFLCIKGYHCTEKCPYCPLHKVGEDLEDLGRTCDKLEGVKPVIDLKIAFHVSEKITFI